MSLVVLSFVQLVLATYIFLVLSSLTSIVAFHIVTRPQKQKEAEAR